MKINVYLLMAGEASRWENYRGVDKHFAPVHDFGPTILSTVDKFNAYKPESSELSIKAVVKVKSKQKFKQLTDRGVELLKAQLSPEYGDADKILSSSSSWASSDAVSVLVWADSWLTDTCVKRIYDAALSGEWTQICRFGANDFTGAVGGENFAVVLPPNSKEDYLAAAQRCGELYKNGIIDRSGGWEIYRAMHGLPDDEILVRLDSEGSVSNPNLGNSTEVIDGSEDFDTPKDWDEWHYRWHTRPETRSMMQYGEE